MIFSEREHEISVLKRCLSKACEQNVTMCKEIQALQVGNISFLSNSIYFCNVLLTNPQSYTSHSCPGYTGTAVSIRFSYMQPWSSTILTNGVFFIWLKLFPSFN